MEVRKWMLCTTGLLPPPPYQGGRASAAKNFSSPTTKSINRCVIFKLINFFIKKIKTKKREKGYGKIFKIYSFRNKSYG